MLGGTLFNKKVISLERVETALRAIASALPELPELKLAMLDGRSGLYGALEFAQTSA